MKLQNQLSVKSALRFALPSLAACLLLAACSNEVSDVIPGDLPSETAGMVRFSASAPLASEDVTTRIGINNDKKPTVDQWEQDEPVIWIGDEEISVFFVSKTDASEFHAKFIIDAENISTDGKSADLVNVTSLSHLNGAYTIYAFTPYVAGNTLAQAQLNLASQSQEANTKTYGHLSKSAYMRAAGGDATFDKGSLKSGDVNFQFRHITSFLRFNITNSLDEDIVVTGISLTHPNMYSGVSFNIRTQVTYPGTAGSTISLILGDKGQSLNKNATFDAYMSSFPVHTYGNFGEKLLLTISIAGEAPIEHLILPSDLGYKQGEDMFAKSTRFLFEINLSKPPYDGAYDVEHGGYVYSYMRVADNLADVIYFDEEPFITIDAIPSACPNGWNFVESQNVGSTNTQRAGLYNALGANFRGVLYSYMGSEMINYGDALCVASRYSDLNYTQILANGSSQSETWDARRLRIRPLCRRLL